MTKIRITSIGDTLLYLLVISIFCFDGDANLNKYLYYIVVAFIGYMVLYCINKRYIALNYFVRWLPFLVFCFLSCLWSVNAAASLSRCYTLLINYILFGLMWVYVSGSNRIDALINAIAIAGAIFAVYIVMSYGGLTPFIGIMRNIGVSDRIGGEVAHLSRIGQSLSIAGVVSFNKIFNEDSRTKKVFYTIMVTIETLVILASQSRTGLAVLLIGMMLSIILGMKSDKNQQRLSIIVGLFVIAFLVTQFVDLTPLLGRWDGLNEILKGGSGDASANARVNMIHIGIEKFLEKPIVGWGIDSSSTFSSYRTYLHDNYVELLSAIGLLGFVTFYYVYVQGFFELAKVRNKDFQTKLSIVLILVQGLLMMSTVSYYVKYQYLVIVLFMAVTGRNSYNYENKIDYQQ